MANKTFILIILTCLGLSFQTLSSSASCQYDPLEGHWAAIKYHRLEPKKVEISRNCPNKIGRRNYSYNEKWLVRAFNHCRPKDCIWGRTYAGKDSSGNIIAKFETFSATRYIKIIPYNGTIEVKYRIDFRSTKRKDLIGSIRMRRIK